ncbi:HpcH/HpaI aldolase/citrate lyase family protein [Arthrobacter sp. A5]|uniref:HpcH/HpaI aldolase/citrate lyase family protein n=1 Tax=Arthrobacter sp. A5 TaxID=576926 RepID=UPI003DA874C7
MTFSMGPALLFCPADRPERYAKAADRADAVILDLEDAVAPKDKAAARGHLTGTPQDPGRTIVRINPLGTADADADLAALQQTQYRTIMVAKAEDASALSELDGFDVVALCETARGVLEAARIATAPNVVALMWGAEDLVASLGGSSSRTDDGGYRAVAAHARSSVLLAAGAFGKTAIDAVHVNIPDLDGLAAEARDAVASGFGATACIHPGQVAVIRDAYTPAPEEVALARELLAAAAASGSGVFAYKGKMIDGPILKHARQTLRRAELT